MSKKQYNTQLSANFYKMSNEIFDFNIPPSDFMIYSYIVMKSDTHTPGQRNLSIELGLSRKTIGQSIKRLQDSGLIKVKKMNNEKKGLKPRFTYSPVPWSEVHGVKSSPHNNTNNKGIYLVYGVKSSPCTKMDSYLKKKSLKNKELFIQIITQQNTESVINELKQYEMKDSKTWLRYIKQYCDESKRDILIKEFNLD